MTYEQEAMDLSEPKMISPLLDGFAMGGPISDHHGVRCCPAMADVSNDKYIVKIISIPASQVQLEALLLTGAYPDEASALNYFKGLSDNIIEEAETLNRLSKLEGFLPCENWQIVPMENGIGYEIYLLTPYRRSLERYFRKNTMTHLAAVNLGLDLCSSLAVCRQAGFLYADLKPGNVFIGEDGSYRIGDLGFIKLDGLKYASVPDRYRSSYTAPEIADAFSPLSSTIDVYAAGMILYQAYNGGVLPFTGQAPAEALESPIYADYEMAEIILKAIDPDPQLRWNDPVQMGQALVAYMQRNSVNDTPIVPPPVVMPEDELEAESAMGEESLSSEEDVAEFTPDEQQIALDGFSLEQTKVISVPKTIKENDSQEASPASSENDDPANLSFLNDLVTDDTAPSEEMAPGVAYEDLSNEMFDILSLADDLISHDAPGPAVAPDPIPISIPQQPKQEVKSPVIVLQNAADAPFDPTKSRRSMASAAQNEPALEYDKPLSLKGTISSKKVVKRIIGTLLTLVIFAGLAFGGYYFYKNYYLRTVSSMVLQGNEDSLVVSITSDVDESLLTVVCTDINGTSMYSSVKDGIAVFNGLNPDSFYRVKVEVSGLRKLTGNISDSYTTPTQTEIVSLTAVTGTDNGSVILSFVIDGEDAPNWTVTYSAEGEQPQSVTFTGHTTTISGLQEGKIYTFSLTTESDLYLVGNNTLEHTVITPIYAENLAITGCTSNTLEATWKTPAGASVAGWNVRCYNDSGYDESAYIVGNSAVFTGLDPTLAYTVEVTAEGMGSGTRCYMSANSITVNEIHASYPDANTVKLSWDYTGTAPKGQWIVLYSVDGSEYQEMVRSDTASVVIKPYVPGSVYDLKIQTESGGTVFGGTGSITTPEAAKFEGYLLSSDTITARMCKQPGKANWTHNDLKKDDYTNTYAVGAKAGFVLNSGRTYNTSTDLITVLFVIRDDQGKPVSNSFVDFRWTNMWYKRYCELDIPVMPDTPGTYTIEIYFNGAYVHDQTFYVK